eukprot:g2315.t1
MMRWLGIGDSFTKRDPMEDKGLLEDEKDSGVRAKEEGNGGSAANGFGASAEEARQSEARIRRFMKGIEKATGTEEKASSGADVESGTASKMRDGGKSSMDSDLGNFIDELENDNIDMYVGDEDDSATAFATQEEVGGYNVEETEFSGEFNAFFTNLRKADDLPDTAEAGSEEGDAKNGVEAGEEKTLIEDI